MPTLIDTAPSAPRVARRYARRNGELLVACGVLAPLVRLFHPPPPDAEHFGGLWEPTAAVAASDAGGAQQSAGSGLVALRLCATMASDPCTQVALTYLGVADGA